MGTEANSYWAGTMTDFVWIATFGLVALLCLTVPRVSLRRHSIDDATLAAFKLMLRHRNLDKVEIPDAALVGIIAEKAAHAKNKAVALGGQPGAAQNNWQRHLILLLDKEADIIEFVIRDGCEKYLDCHSTQMLLKYGAIEPHPLPALSVDQFADASKRGTLYSELDERQAAREFS